ncbi:MAG: hypothetical protein M3454_04245 [Actinomycetota bacterium]|nr:hypothetical protein [Actinomycetota bacterium]
MNDHKLEPRLANLVEERMLRVVARGMTAADVEAEAITVTISHEENIPAEEGQETDEALQALESSVEQSQAVLMSKLEEFGTARWRDAAHADERGDGQINAPADDRSCRGGRSPAHPA